MAVTIQKVLDREGEATVTKSVRMALAGGHRALFEQFQSLVDQSSLEGCLVEAVELLVAKHTGE